VSLVNGPHDHTVRYRRLRDAGVAVGLISFAAVAVGLVGFALEARTTTQQGFSLWHAVSGWALLVSGCTLGISGVFWLAGGRRAPKEDV
jgi:hypothetical protein